MDIQIDLERGEAIITSQTTVRVNIQDLKTEIANLDGYISELQTKRADKQAVLDTILPVQEQAITEQVAEVSVAENIEHDA